MKRIVIDMDEVIADPHAKFIEMFNAEFQLGLHKDQLHGGEISDAVPPELRHKVLEYINTPGFFRHLPIIPDSQEVLKALQEKYEVYIVSAATEFRNSLIDKLDWLNDYFPFISWQQVVFCGNKIVHGDIMIDDRSRNFTHFMGDRKLLFTSSHNVNETAFERVNTWKEVAEKLL